jgi:hypothetical protein
VKGRSKWDWERGKDFYHRGHREQRGKEEKKDERRLEEFYGEALGMIAGGNHGQEAVGARA